MKSIYHSLNYGVIITLSYYYYNIYIWCYLFCCSKVEIMYKIVSAILICLTNDQTKHIKKKILHEIFYADVSRMLNVYIYVLGFLNVKF